MGKQRKARTTNIIAKATSSLVTHYKYLPGSSYWCYIQMNLLAAIMFTIDLALGLQHVKSTMDWHL